MKMRVCLFVNRAFIIATLTEIHVGMKILAEINSARILFGLTQVNLLRDVR